MPENTKCSKCSSELDTSGYPQWCKVCRAKYKREYDETKAKLTESRGYAAGISAMRAFLYTRFDRLGSGSFSGREIADIIARTPGP